MVAVARRVAYSVLESLVCSHETLDALLSRTLEKEPGLDQRDKALATELVFGVVRWQGRLDWVIQQISNIPLAKIDPRILQVIRLGLYQILFLSKVPHAAAVNESVNLAKKRAPKWVAGYVNGVLRAAIRKGQIDLPKETDDPITALCVEESYPRWLIDRWVARLGLSETRKLCRANNRIPPVTIRVNTLKASRQKVTEALIPFVQEIQPTKYAPDGLSLKGMKQPIADMAPFRKGWFQVQDEAAQLVSFLLNPRPTERILDGCAGFGGKTGHIAQLMKDSGHIAAIDNNHGKLEALGLAMARLGVSCVTPWHRDLASPVVRDLIRTCDRVLLDAPCSGLGVLRRNPDAKWRKKAENFKALVDRQKTLLKSTAFFVKKQGILVYCVCSMEPEEGDDVIQDFLKTHTDFVIDKVSSVRSDLLGAFGDRSGVFKTSPHEHNMDGFFAARLRRV